MYKKVLEMVALIFMLLGAAPTCAPGGEEPVAVSLPVLCDGTASRYLVNDQGWQVQIDILRMAVRDFTFTIQGETHASLFRSISDVLVPSAHAHPGHSAGGEVTGAMPGNFILDFSSGVLSPIGTGTLLVGEYEGFNLYFRVANSDDGLDAADPLLGHGVYIKGTAQKEKVVIPFSAVIDEPVDGSMDGGVFAHIVKEGTQAPLILTFADWVSLEDESQETIFDGIDFLSLETDAQGDVSIEPGSASHNMIMKQIVIHDYWEMISQS